MQSLAVAPQAEATVEKKSGKLTKNSVTQQVFTVTNGGVQPGVFRLKATRKGRVKTKLLNDLLYLEAGASEDVVVYARGSKRAKVGLKATLEGA